MNDEDTVVLDTDGVEDEGRKRCEQSHIKDYILTVSAPRTFLLQANLLQNKYLRNQKKTRKCENAVNG